MVPETSLTRKRLVVPSRSLVVLVSIGLIDLIVTAVLHAYGLIVELNPIMRPFIEQSEWLFVLVKGSTLIIAWCVMAPYAKVNRLFVRRVSNAGIAAYMVIWLSWFLSSM